MEHTTELLLVMRRQVRAAVRQAVRFGHQIEHPSRNGIPSSSLFLRKKEDVPESAVVLSIILRWQVGSAGRGDVL